MKVGFPPAVLRREEFGKCKLYVTLNKVKIKTGPSHKSVLMLLFGRQEEWSTKILYGIGAKTMYMLCCLTVGFGVLATVSGQQTVHCFGLTDCVGVIATVSGQQMLHCSGLTICISVLATISGQ
jgi:hypothetical protein